MITDLESCPSIRGALAFIEAIATDDQKQEAAALDQGVGPESQNWSKPNARRTLAETVHGSFKLHNFVGLVSPLAKEMSYFRLYYSKHSADALAAAWCQTKRGGLAADALNADYDYTGGGIMHLQDVDELVAEAKKLDNGKMTWDRLRGYYHEGDHVLSYTYGGGFGYVVLRKRRLVCEMEAYHCQRTLESGIRMAGEIKAYKEAGGFEAVLSGKLVWPPPGWVNPVTDEMARAEARRIQREIVSR